MMQIQRHFRFSLLLCLVPTVQLFGQAPTLTVSTPLNPGSPIQVTGTKGSSVAIYSPSKDGVSCGDAGLFDLGNPLLIHEGADSPAQTLPSDRLPAIYCSKCSDFAEPNALLSSNERCWSHILISKGWRLPWSRSVRGAAVGA